MPFLQPGLGFRAHREDNILAFSRQPPPHLPLYSTGKKHYRCLPPVSDGQVKRAAKQIQQTAFQDQLRCASMLGYWNQASECDAEKLFLKVLNPLEVSAATKLLPRGTAGPRLSIQAPFQCLYGYNLTFGADVVIGPDCKIDDSCEVRIGDRCRLESCVTLMQQDHQKRQPTTIGSACYIGSGTKIHTGSTIEEGCVIGKSVMILAPVHIGSGCIITDGVVISTEIRLKPRFRVTRNIVGC